MVYQIHRVIDAGLADSSFLVEMEKAAIALARVDERLRRSEPLVQRGLLARTLYKTVKVGAPVPRNLYKAVAEVLSFVYKLKKKKKALA